MSLYMQPGILSEYLRRFTRWIYCKLTPVVSTGLATYYGGTQQDDINSCAADSLGHLFVCGWTFSPNAMASAGAFKPFMEEALGMISGAF